ncbi:hypothetical protein ACJX0J_030591, partial [Zea mays]
LFGRTLGVLFGRILGCIELKVPLDLILIDIKISYSVLYFGHVWNWGYFYKLIIVIVGRQEVNMIISCFLFFINL